MKLEMPAHYHHPGSNLHGLFHQIVHLLWGAAAEKLYIDLSAQTQVLAPQFIHLTKV